MGAKSILFLLMIAASLLTAAPVNNPLSPPAQKPATLKGKIVEIGTGEPVAFVNILLQELNRSATSREDGTFQIPELAPEPVTLKTFRIGYTNIAVPIVLTPGDTLAITITLDRAVIHTGGVTIESSRLDNSSPVAPDILFSDKKLHQALGQTVAQTIDYEPGISQRTMGPAPARPVLRGLGGDRLLMLEDSEQTGDLSATSTDHAVVIEPLTAERIEVIRGPEALVYGPNTLGGVVNVIRGYVPWKKITSVTGSASFMGETVSRGGAGGIELAAPLGPVTLRADGSLRNAGNVDTPGGTLINTDIRTLNGSAGLSLVEPWGYAGAAAAQYQSEYGIPPDPHGGHPSGVNIKLERRHLESKGEYRLDSFGVQRVTVGYNHSVYFHQEFEASGDLGMEYGVVSDFVDAQAFLRSGGWLRNGVFGVRLNSRDYASGGLTFTPNTFESGAAAFYYQELQIGAFALHGSLRYDYKDIDPVEQRLSRTVGQIRRRTFQDYSAGLSPHWLLNSRWTLSGSFLRTFRAPTTEELFSEGPHLAAYSYEVGNADLGKENGVGLELSLDYKREDSFVRLAVYQNDIENYTFPQNTGERSWTRADLFVYKYIGADVRMRGAEMSFHLPLTDFLHAAGSASYVWGELVDEKKPIPYVPPLEGKLNLGYEAGAFNMSAAVRAASRQDRVGEFEPPTDGYVVFDLHAQYLISSHRHLHSLSFTVENVFDIVYRKHLNRVREVLPEPGRNFRLLYKIFI